MRVHVRGIILSSAAVRYLLGRASEPRAKCGNEEPSSFLGRAVGPPGGDVGREEGVNNVGINIFQRRQRQREEEGKEQNEGSFANKPASTALLVIAIKLKYAG